MKFKLLRSDQNQTQGCENDEPNHKTNSTHQNKNNFSWWTTTKEKWQMTNFYKQAINERAIPGLFLVSLVFSMQLKI